MIANSLNASSGKDLVANLATVGFRERRECPSAPRRPLEGVEIERHLAKNRRFSSN